MRTLGIDLASQPSKTAACIIDWSHSPALVTESQLGLTNDDLVKLTLDSDKVGIDAPFGWPDAFIRAIDEYAGSNRWPDVPLVELRYRYTDLEVTAAAKRPLSVASDLIAVTAMRCASLLSLLEQAGESTDRSGTGKVVEVYPAAALVVWGFESTGLKKEAGREKRRELTSGLLTALENSLDVRSEVIALCEKSDDALDALIASLIARCAALGLTVPPQDDRRDQARREGWIHLPLPGSLSRLA
jgi:predicted nuclease with RNAse H fold